MQCYAEHSIATVSHLSVHPSIHPSVRKVEVSLSHRLEYFEGKICAPLVSLGLHTSWQKTKIHTIGHGSQPPSVHLVASGQTVEGVEQFVYLGSNINTR